MITCTHVIILIDVEKFVILKQVQDHFEKDVLDMFSTEVILFFFLVDLEKVELVHVMKHFIYVIFDIDIVNP